MKKVILLPEDRLRFETTLGQALPNPSTPEFDEFLDVVQGENPELATEIRNSLKVLGIPSANDVQAVKAKETKKNAAFWQRLFYKQTPDGWVQDKGKITRSAILAVGTLACVLALGLFVRPAQSSGFSLGGLKNNKVPVDSTATNTTDPNAPIIVPAPNGTNPDPNNPNPDPNNPNPDPNNPNGTNPDPNNPNPDPNNSINPNPDPNNPNPDPNAPNPEPFDASPTPRQTPPVNSNGSSGTASSGFSNQTGSSQNNPTSNPSNSGSSNVSSANRTTSSSPKALSNAASFTTSGKSVKHNFSLQNSNPNPSGARVGSAMVL
ncbi:MAG: hypothetical protein RLZZ156_345, partial [Deinococcota bacterium]